MAYTIVLSTDAQLDIDEAVEYFNNISFGLGFMFTDVIDAYFQKISNLPTASAVRYDDVRVKPIDTFSYTIHYVINNDNTVTIARIFNTNQQPLW